MRTTCRLTLGIAIFVAAAGVASAQQSDPQPPPAPLPETQVAPAPLPPDIVPPTEETSATPVLPPIPTAPDLIVTATAEPVKKASSPPAKKLARATASKKPIEKPATPESSSQAKEAAATAIVVTADSASPPPPGAAGTADVPAGTASSDLSKKPPPAVDPAVQAEIDEKGSDAAQRKKGVSGWILLGVAVLSLTGLAVYFVRSRSGVSRLPPIFDGGLAARARSPLVSGRRVAAVRSGPAP